MKQELGTDNDTPQSKEGVMNIDSSLVSHPQAAELVQPA
jgi:hypothetical protein